ncbi:homogentisate 1,2-dioxygenase [Frankia sp. CNm7]|uniref:Homogentisate 1,2-dioxygenase n=1 Tax=Frankia nepalensis TaxID=1836974 RepID=A0A937RKE9_9ACTN|nr:homogentisate 1,2-dioxygenase domain-containing protein [Frankia nepalensis]MBL7496578.1 homogentisate 1,2-dioxygenase [Frankia nepalensis]MBL7508797.1 homogentisate 1,2-dioxygenase [Frankia nepalensis]MBL7518944.1 homogentisate 1,2-dioxygenase [Frankia nepalensis]MBL7627551.1 homogentisate 1,2-dioxygenase [Frankia nepalensis]
MAYYRAVGSIPPKRHTQHRAPSGNLYYEELMGADGFTSGSSLLYHRAIPSAIVDATPWEPPEATLTENRPLLPRHLRLHELFPGEEWKRADPVTGRRLILGNADVQISYVVAGEPSPLYRNAGADECVYVESGSATVETVFGALTARQGDYVLLPRSTTHRWRPDGDGGTSAGPASPTPESAVSEPAVSASAGPLRLYVIEARSHLGPPRRYQSAEGQLLEHAPYCERDLRGPTEPLLAEGTDVEVLVKHPGAQGAAGTRYVYPTHPFDVVGWDGCLYPYTFNIADFEPVTGRVHQPPPAHQVFAGDGFVICNFVPRKVDYHPLAVPVPYYHSNVDSAEVMFYCGGDYAAREGSGIGQGSVSLHPGGHCHGPQPGAVERSLGVEFFDELAVMVDTFRPLRLGEGGLAAEDPAYAWTWSGRGPTR